MSNKPQWSIVPNDPSGTERVHGFVDRYDEARAECVGGVGSWEMQTFSPEDRDRGRSLRDAREAAGFTLWDAAEAAGLRSSEVSYIERGRLRLKRADGGDVSPEEYVAACLAHHGRRP